MARIGADAMIRGREDGERERWSVIEEGETAAEREAIGEINGSLRRLEETVEAIWNEYEYASRQDSTPGEDNVFSFAAALRKKAG